MKEITFENLNLNIIDIWSNQWFLLTSGDYKKNDYNTMTIAWGSIGVMWNKPIVMVVVRPVRYTYYFMEKYNDFSITAFDGMYKDTLSYLGNVSGRKEDKIKQSKLHIVESQKILSPTFMEAELSIECKKIYFNDLHPEHFLDTSIEEHYPNKDYHRLYFGEIIHIQGTRKYIKHT